MHELHYCEICDRSWMTPEELEIHISEHVPCHVKGCSFTAAPKLVALHVKLQHDSGIFDRIVKSNNTEDIEKWREERRRNFPTLSNIERKNSERKEMEERGERMNFPSKSFQNNKFTNNHLKGKSEDDNFRNKRKRNQFKNSGNKLVCNESTKQQFLSTASLPNDLEDIGIDNKDQDCNISDEEWISDTQGIVEATPISTALMALSNVYASDEDEHQEKISEQEKSGNVESFLELCSKSDDEPPSEEKIERSNNSCADVEKIEDDKFTDRFSKRKRSHNKTKLKPNVMNWQPSLKKRPLSLLEKLLAKEIKQERNYILQCIRYIINEKYFET